jgi:alpha-L-fucosidase
MKRYELISRIILALAIILNTFYSSAQQGVHPQSSTYEWPTEADVKAKLEKWQDQKRRM